MAIKFIIKTGNKPLNDTTRAKVDRLYKPAFKGARCENPQCEGGDTTVRFIENADGRAVATYEPCCTAFEAVLREKAKTYMP
jgi:hypothetical protein